MSIWALEVLAKHGGFLFEVKPPAKIVHVSSKQNRPYSRVVVELESIRIEIYQDRDSGESITIQPIIQGFEQEEEAAYSFDMHNTRGDKGEVERPTPKWGVVEVGVLLGIAVDYSEYDRDRLSECPPPKGFLKDSGDQFRVIELALDQLLQICATREAIKQFDEEHSRVVERWIEITWGWKSPA